MRIRATRYLPVDKQVTPQLEKGFPTGGLVAGRDGERVAEVGDDVFQVGGLPRPIVQLSGLLCEGKNTKEFLFVVLLLAKLVYNGAIAQREMSNIAQK